MFRNKNTAQSSFNTEPRIADGLKESTELQEILNGRHLIDQDTPVTNGVFLPRDDRWEKTTIVDCENKTMYERYLDIAARKATNRRGKILRTAMPKAVYDTVSQEMKPKTRGPFEAKRPDTVWRSDWPEYVGLGNENLSSRMADGSREPHHKALAIAALLEIYTQREGIDAQVSVDTGTRVGQKDPNDLEIHTWARFTDPTGEVYILDAAKGYYGRLEDSMSGAPWNYLRDGDFEYIAARRQQREISRAEHEKERRAREVGLIAVEYAVEPDSHRAA